jgi:beta-glucanase (GH16 family)
MTSYESFKFANGYAEIRAKLPEVDGLWPAFWLLNGYYIAQQPEIDIMEALGEEPTRLYHTYHLNNGTSQVTQGLSIDAAGYTDGFHTYGVRWQPGKIVWYVDGVEAHSYTNDNVAYQLMYVIANLAVEGSFNNAPLDVGGLPASMDIDYIRVYQERD